MAFVWLGWLAWLAWGSGARANCTSRENLDRFEFSLLLPRFGPDFFIRSLSHPTFHASDYILPFTFPNILFLRKVSTSLR